MNVLKMNKAKMPVSASTNSSFRSQNLDVISPARLYFSTIVFMIPLVTLLTLFATSLPLLTMSSFKVFAFSKVRSAQLFFHCFLVYLSWVTHPSVVLSFRQSPFDQLQIDHIIHLRFH